MIYQLQNPAIKLETDDSYMNRTENKDPREPGERYLLHVWHETATGSHPPKARNTLEWNLHKVHPTTGQKIYSSYDILIAWDGTVYRYVDWREWNSWAEGVSHATVDGKLLTSGPLGRAALSTEIDGMNRGIKASAAQIESAAKVRIMIEETEGIAIDGKHDFTHAEIAPGRKSDPRGYTIREVFDEVTRLRSLQPNWRLRWGNHAHYDPAWGIPTAWRKAWEQGSQLGKAISHEYIHPLNPDFVRQDFEFGVINWTPAKTYISGPITLR
jgi:hypothetical protein